MRKHVLLHSRNNGHLVAQSMPRHQSNRECKPKQLKHRRTSSYLPLSRPPQQSEPARRNRCPSLDSVHQALKAHLCLTVPGAVSRARVKRKPRLVDPSFPLCESTWKSRLNLMPRSHASSLRSLMMVGRPPTSRHSVTP
jgi:hypothetical protein